MAFDLLNYICPPNGKQYRLFGLGDESCQCFQADDGWIEFRKNKHVEEFYVTDTVIGRGADTSEISRDGVNPTEKFYVQYTRQPDGSLSYGAPWAKRFMDVGESFHRLCHVIHYRADGAIIEESDPETDLVVNAHHPSRTFPQSGITIEDVLELQWGGEEVYFYANGFGLVGWKNLRTGVESFVGVLSATIQPPFPHAIARPRVGMPTIILVEPTKPKRKRERLPVSRRGVTTSIFFQVQGARVKVRRDPGLQGALLDQTLNPGDVIEVEADTATEKDGYVWWKHTLGWSAERTADAAPHLEVLMKQVDRTSSIPVSRRREIEPTALFEVAPVSLSETVWLQYFGNTNFAFNLSLDRDPNRQKSYYFAQGLHSGIDYGNDAMPIVLAGVRGVVKNVFRNSAVYAPNYVVVKVDSDLTVIYGHIHNIPQELVEGSIVDPMTKIGEIAPQGAQGSPHLHLEIRHANKKMINPLLFMPAGMSMALTERFANFEKHFHRDPTWTKWLTPLDQPVLELVPRDPPNLIGPLGARG
jgi:hypothetical protein